MPQCATRGAVALELSDRQQHRHLFPQRAITALGARTIALTDAVIESVITLREAHKVRVPDAIIAASAITENLPLMTHNTRDFKRIKQLNLLDPFEMGGTA